MELPFNYYELDGKTVLDEERQATVIDLSYHGMFAISPDAVTPFTDIKLSLSLSLIGNEVREIYAKVMSVRKMAQGYGWGIEFTALDSDSQSAIKEFVDSMLERR